MKERSKRYEEAAKLIEPNKAYGPSEALALIKKMPLPKFDATVELHIKMGLDPRNASQQVRGVATLPNGLGKTVRVLVFAQGEADKIARDAGADNVGADDIIKKIEEGWLEFDVTIATPDMMGRVSKLGKILGRKGLMPNPKSGTVVQPADLPRVINESRKGRVEFKLDRNGLIHLVIGKISFDEKKLLENLTGVIEAIVKAKPSGAKGQYVETATVSATMGPGVPLDLKTTLALTTE
ncbi:MAG: 50S ribosomal protein L1 [Dehalococcoidales bacterium]|nr:50S ribosomal protein L1 [Dehalococcoidales bacterium]